MTRPMILRVVAGLVAAALAAVLVWQGLALRHDHQLDDRGDAAVRVAQDQVLDLTTLDSHTVSEKIKAMRERTTGDFSRQLEGIAKSFVDAVTKAKLTASGDIDAAAITKIDDARATVLVATTVLVTNKKEPKPATRSYRMKVDLIWSDDHWLIDGMEFVA
jgi:Mce-associated membrane protein